MSVYDWRRIYGWMSHPETGALYAVALAGDSPMNRTIEEAAGPFTAAERKADSAGEWIDRAIAADLGACERLARALDDAVGGYEIKYRADPRDRDRDATA